VRVLKVCRKGGWTYMKEENKYVDESDGKGEGVGIKLGSE
jgi:hypothetical protein